MGASGTVATAVARCSGSRTLTVGVEEEFLLLDRADGRPALSAPAVLALLGGDPHIKAEAMRYQLETVTGVCTDLEQLAEELTRHRLLASRSAEELGCHLVASGIVPRHTPGLSALTADARYEELAARHGLVAGTGTCGCHVHVGMPSRELGVQVLTRLRPFLATLLALSANSPIAGGVDTGWASRRHRQWSRWPTAVPPGAWRSAADYDAAVCQLIRCGRAMDERSVYFHARLSPRYPTVELRVMDTCLSVEDAVLLAAMARALVCLAIADVARGVPIKTLSDRQVVAELNAAARHGLDALAVDPYTSRAMPHRALLELLLPRLPEPEPIALLIHRLDGRGTGAARQRTMWSQAGTPPRFAQLLAGATLR
ncbi:YbdK family carboxylate-amine ligase [Nonomuraea sp. NPDC049400]|uniref:carboxylate-amine ligase n=1 Tax=Nonomuraea sp. NPDC049400 TaxID=3364352 RepID=UPI0037B9C8BA